jgi:leader peptidase (prepilin peptidase)/N-methyltransferase
LSLSLQAFTVVCALIFGLNIGSFLNVVIWRLPRGGSIASPTWSYCPRCEHRLGALDLMPVASFVALRARCRYCRERISWRYPAIETLTACLFGMVAWRYYGSTVDTVCYCLFVAALICVFFIDLEHFLIPDGLNVTAALIGFVHNGIAIAMRRPGQFDVLAGIRLPASLAGFAAYAIIVYTVGLLSYIALTRRNPFVAAWIYISDNVVDWFLIALYYAGTVIPPLRRFTAPSEPLEGWTAEEIEADEEAGGMGSGDGKLAAAVGANIYVSLALQSGLLAIFIGATFGLVKIIRERRRLGRTAMPFGPYMAAGAFLSLVFGPNLVALWHWYLLTASGNPHAAMLALVAVVAGTGALAMLYYLVAPSP